MGIIEFAYKMVCLFPNPILPYVAHALPYRQSRHMARVQLKDVFDRPVPIRRHILLACVPGCGLDIPRHIRLLFNLQWPFNHPLSR